MSLKKFKIIVQSIYLSITDKRVWQTLFFSAYSSINRLFSIFDTIVIILGRCIKLYLYAYLIIFYCLVFEYLFWALIDIFTVGGGLDGIPAQMFFKNSDIATLYHVLGFDLVGKICTVLAYCAGIGLMLTVYYIFFFDPKILYPLPPVEVENFFNNPQVLLLFSFLWNFLLTVVGILLATALLTL